MGIYPKFQLTPNTTLSEHPKKMPKSKHKKTFKNTKTRELYLGILNTSCSLAPLSNSLLAPFSTTQKSNKKT
jgi:hypothetical protein